MQELSAVTTVSIILSMTLIYKHEDVCRMPFLLESISDPNFITDVKCNMDNYSMNLRNYPYFCLLSPPFSK